MAPRPAMITSKCVGESDLVFDGCDLMPERSLTGSQRKKAHFRIHGGDEARFHIDFRGGLR